MNASEFAEQTGQTTQELKEQAGQKAAELKGTALEWKNKAQRMARDAGAYADDYVHENTWTAVALVAVAAAFLGFLLGRRD